MENHAKYGDSIYFHDADQSLFLNLFIASELNWKSKGLRLRQETAFPMEPSTKLAFTCEKPVQLTLHLRRPAWAVTGMEVRVNGRRQWLVSQPGEYAILSRIWRNGDTVEVTMPFSVRTEGFRDNPQRFAFLYGPLVLCAEIGPKGPIPAIVTADAQPSAKLQPIEGKPGAFKCPEALFRIADDNRETDVVLEPFYKTHGDRHYVVYWDSFSPSQWQDKRAKDRVERARLPNWTCARSIPFALAMSRMNARTSRRALIAKRVRLGYNNSGMRPKAAGLRII